MQKRKDKSSIARKNNIFSGRKSSNKKKKGVRKSSEPQSSGLLFHLHRHSVPHNRIIYKRCSSDHSKDVIVQWLHINNNNNHHNSDGRSGSRSSRSSRSSCRNEEKDEGSDIILPSSYALAMPWYEFYFAHQNSSVLHQAHMLRWKMNAIKKQRSESKNKQCDDWQKRKSIASNSDCGSKRNPQDNYNHLVLAHERRDMDPESTTFSEFYNEEKKSMAYSTPTSHSLAVVNSIERGT
eukprot:m.100744 g.100744  ORF g.100744 m.100744 type:complete len:237 (-) comp9050_c0_seq4:703-1413(-)